MTRFFAVLVLLCSGVGPASAARLEPGLTAEAREHLKALVRLDTSNPPGNELTAARYLKTKLDKEGISSRVYVSSPTRASLIARIPGSGEKRPLLLMCHTDVVAAERSQWSSDPFTPVEKDGYLYGRGTADIKGMCAAQLSVMLWLKRSRTPLSRDVIFFAEADEENGGPGRHIEWLLDKHGRELEAEFAINEGGNTLWEDGRVSEIRVQASEKEFMDITLIARGESGHSSVPRSGNAVAALARAAARLSEKRFPARADEVVRGFLERQAPLSGTPLAEAIAEVLRAEPGETLDAAADRLAALHPEFGAMLRDTVTPTMLSAGYKSNVVPGEARAVFNARLLPGTRPEDFLAAVREAVDDPSVEVRAEPPPRPSVPAMPVATELYGAIEEAARKRAPGAPVMPFMAAWTTDSQDLRARGVIVYGLDPPLSEEDGRRVHGVDERIPLAALDWYEEFLRDVVIGVAGK